MAENLKDAIASHVSAASVNAPAREDERRRAEAPRAEEVLRESDARLRAVIEEAPLAIALTGQSGEILLRNPRFDQLWGRPAHVTTAPTYSDVYEGYHLDGRRDRIGGVAWRSCPPRGETIENEVYGIVQATGRRIACWFGAAPLRNTSGEIVGAVVVFRNVTDERAHREALRQRKRRTRRSRSPQGRIHRGALARAAQPAGADPLRAPAAGEEPFGERGRRAIAVIERQVAHVVRMSIDLLDVSRITTARSNFVATSSRSARS